jgi:hypothetical protein
VWEANASKKLILSKECPFTVQMQGNKIPLNKCSLKYCKNSPATTVLYKRILYRIMEKYRTAVSVVQKNKN